MVAVVIILPPLLHGIPVVRGSVKLEDSKAVYISKWEVILKLYNNTRGASITFGAVAGEIRGNVWIVDNHAAE